MENKIVFLVVIILLLFVLFSGIGASQIAKVKEKITKVKTVENGK